MIRHLAKSDQGVCEDIPIYFAFIQLCHMSHLIFHFDPGHCIALFQLRRPDGHETCPEGLWKGELKVLESR